MEGLGATHGTAVAGNHGHLANFYCFDNADPDAISAFQVYDSFASSQRSSRLTPSVRT